MSATPVTIRCALVSELAHAIAIDEATGAMFHDIGLYVDFPQDHPFVQAERARWRDAAEGGELFWAVAGIEIVGFYALRSVDGGAYLEQLSVHPDQGRRGLGRTLLEHAFDRCRRQGRTELVLTTYSHVPWNRPFYERSGFELVSAAELGPELSALLDEQRRVLPRPQERVVMRREL